MQAEKRGLKSKIKFGLIILTPLCLLFYFSVTVFNMFSFISYQIFWNYVYSEIPQPLSGITGIFILLLLSWLTGSIYYKERAKLSVFIDKLVKSVPFVKYFWHPGGLKNRSGLDLSNLKAACVEYWPGVWRLVFIVGKQEFENRKTLTAVIRATFPLPFTGDFDLIDEEKMIEEKRIYYLKNHPSEIVRIFLSLGFLRPEKFLEEK